MARANENLDFLIIGVGKSGTTSLAEVLARHPDIALTRPKEPWFFDSEDYQRGMGWYWQRYLGHHRGEPCVGEASSQTLFVPYAPERIRAVAPRAKLLAILRDPVERAYSDWWMKYCTGLETDSFEQALEKNLRQIESGVDFADPRVWQEHLDSHRATLRYKTYLEYGNYATQVERYLAHFPREQLLLLTTEQLAQDFDATLRRVWQFLGVGSPPGPQIAPPASNPSRSPLIGAMRRGVYGVPVAGDLLRQARRRGGKLLPAGARRRARGWLRRLDRGQKPPLPPAAGRMLAQYYREETLRLQTILGRDLSVWTSGEQPANGGPETPGGGAQPRQVPPNKTS